MEGGRQRDRDTCKGLAISILLSMVRINENQSVSEIKEDLEMGLALLAVCFQVRSGEGTCEVVEGRKLSLLPRPEK